MSVLRNCILASLMAVLFISSNANATVYVPDYGSSGMQTFSYTFASDFEGIITIGVSDQGDYAVTSTLALDTYDIEINTAFGTDTSAYMNTLGEAGTQGELYSFGFTAAAGETLSFDWMFSTDDYHPFHDFAFIDIGSMHYEVLAEINAVPVPAAVWLFGSGLLGLLGLRKRSHAVSQPA